MSAVDELVALVSSKINAFNTLVRLIKLEARLAKLSIVPLIMTTCLLVIVLLSTWTTALVMMGYILYQLCSSIYISIGILLAMHGLLSAFLFHRLTVNANNMVFSRTRHFLSHHDEVK